MSEFIVTFDQFSGWELQEITEWGRRTVASGQTFEELMRAAATTGAIGSPCGFKITPVRM